MKLHGNACTCPKSRRLLVDRVLGDGWSVTATPLTVLHPAMRLTYLTAPAVMQTANTTNECTAPGSVFLTDAAHASAGTPQEPGESL